MEDVTSGIVKRNDPKSWYPSNEISVVNNGEVLGGSSSATESNANGNKEDLDPWPHVGYASFPDIMLSLGAGYVCGSAREYLAERVFEPLFGTRELVCSREGFTFFRPLVVDLDESSGSQLVWNPYNSNPPTKGSSDEELHFRPLLKVCGKPQQVTEGQHFDQGVPASAMNQSNGTKQKQHNGKIDKTQKVCEMTGFIHIQSTISFVDQSIDKDRNGGHFICYPRAHSEVQHNLVGGTYRATPRPNEKKIHVDPTWCPLTDAGIFRLDEMGYHIKRIYPKAGDVVIWRSDLVHAAVAPTLTVTNNFVNGKSVLVHKGSSQFRAVHFCSMLPMDAIKDYQFYSLPQHKLKDTKNGGKEAASGYILQPLDCPRHTQQSLLEEFHRRRLEAYRTFRSGDHRPDVESWHEHRRITSWNSHLQRTKQQNGANNTHHAPPRIHQRPRYRLGPPALTERLAELYGLIPYRQLTNDSDLDKQTRQKDIERAVIRGVRFVDGVHKGKYGNGEDVEPWVMKDGKYCLSGSVECGNDKQASADTPVCNARIEVLMPRSADGSSNSLSGQDKYLGGMASPCGRFVYGVPGHAKRVIQVAVESGEVSWIGPEYKGEFKWLRGVEISAEVMGKKADGSLAYPSGCCLALPCNSEDGCVLKIDPETATVSTFGTPPKQVKQGWLYHGGNLASDGYIYAIPATAPRVMKIDPRQETTHYIGPNFQGKAKWYGGIMGIDGCIYGENLLIDV